MVFAARCCLFPRRSRGAKAARQRSGAITGSAAAPRGLGRDPSPDRSASRRLALPQKPTPLRLNGAMPGPPQYEASATPLRAHRGHSPTGPRRRNRCAGPPSTGQDGPHQLYRHSTGPRRGGAALTSASMAARRRSANSHAWRNLSAWLSGHAVRTGAGRNASGRSRLIERELTPGGPSPLPSLTIPSLRPCPCIDPTYIQVPLP